MREILFRGKSVPGGRWLYGDYMSYAGGAQIWTHDADGGTWNAIVDLTTVGQYTGLTDKNGKKIFDGDILKFDDMGIYPVWWDADYCTFGSCWFSDFDPLHKYDSRKIEVIGNIHDNPELLTEA